MSSIVIVPGYHAAVVLDGGCRPGPFCAALDLGQAWQDLVGSSVGADCFARLVSRLVLVCDMSEIWAARRLGECLMTRSEDRFYFRALKNKYSAAPESSHTFPLFSVAEGIHGTGWLESREDAAKAWRLRHCTPPSAVRTIHARILDVVAAKYIGAGLYEIVVSPEGVRIASKKPEIEK